MYHISYIIYPYFIGIEVERKQFGILKGWDLLFMIYALYIPLCPHTIGILDGENDGVFFFHDPTLHGQIAATK
jgi:hypothetical protein